MNVALLAGDVFGNGRSDWHFEQSRAGRPSPSKESRAPSLEGQTTKPIIPRRPQPTTPPPIMPPMNIKPMPDDDKATENDDGLSRVEFDEWALVNQQKNDARYPAQDVTKQTSYIFLKAFGWRSCGSRSGSDGRRLIGATLWTKGCRTNFLTTRFAKCHECPSQEHTLRGRVAEQAKEAQ